MLLDNLWNFQFHFAVAFLACAAALAFRGRRLAALAASAAALLPIARVAPWYLDREAPAADEARPVKLLVSNVYYGNRKYGRIWRLIRKEDPDIVGLIEIDLDWQSNLARLRASHPYFYEVPDERYVGLGLYSRLPLADARTLVLPGSGLPAVAATVPTPRGDVEIILVHLPSPTDAALVRRRNEQAAKLARHVQALGKPAVVAGDFNMTMWSDGYRPLEKTALGIPHKRRIKCASWMCRSITGPPTLCGLKKSLSHCGSEITRLK